MLFQIFGAFLQWVVSYKSGSEVIPNYLALLLFSCLPNNPPYQALLMTLRDVAKDLGVPLKRGSKWSYCILGHQVRLLESWITFSWGSVFISWGWCNRQFAFLILFAELFVRGGFVPLQHTVKAAAECLEGLNFLKPFVEPRVSWALLSGGLRVPGQQECMSEGGW